MRLTTYNIRMDTPQDGDWRWQQRKPYVLENLRRLAPALFTVEEARPEQYADLNAMPEYDHVGTPRDNGVDLGEATALYYDPLVFELQSAGHQWIADPPDRPGRYPGAGSLRVFQWAMLTIRATNKPLLAVATHLDDQSAEARVAGVQQIAAFVQPALVEGIPVVIAGDFNMLPDDAAYAAMPSSLKDALTVAEVVDDPLGGTWMDDVSYIPHQDPVMQRLDYWFVSANVKVKKYAVDTTVSAPGKYASDHFALSLDVEV